MVNTHCSASGLLVDTSFKCMPVYTVYWPSEEANTLRPYEEILGNVKNCAEVYTVTYKEHDIFM